MSGLPRFHLERVFDDGSREDPVLHPVWDFPEDMHLSRRQFAGSSLTLASTLALLGGCAAEERPAPAPKPAAKPPATPAPKPAPAVAKPAPPAAKPAPARPEKPRFERPVLAHTQAIRTLAFSQGGELLASAGADRRVKVWRAFEGRLLHKLDGHTEAVIAVALSPDGAFVVSASHDDTVRRWDLPSGKARTLLSGEPLNEFAMAPQADRMAGGAPHQKLFVWSMAGRGLGSVPIKSSLGPVRLSADGRQLAFVSGAATTVRDTSSLDTPTATIDSPHGFADLAFSADGRQLAACRGAVVELRSLPEGKLRDTVMLASAPRRLAFTPDGSRLLCGCADGTLRILLAQQPAQPVVDLRGHLTPILALTVTADGRYAASGDATGAIILWDLERGDFHGFLFDPEANRHEGITYDVLDQATGRTITYTLPCGSPIPANAVCTCNCVPGRYVPVPAPSAPATSTPRATTPRRSGGGRFCTCDKVCTCVPVRVPSDRETKTDFAALDAARVLEALARLPICEWRYREEPPGTRHLGPMAQDFAALFGLGDDDRSIHAADAQGVALAAIQALHARIEVLEARLAALTAGREEP